MFRSIRLSGSGVLLACAVAACGSPSVKEMNVDSKPPSRAIEAKAPGKVQVSEVKPPPTAAIGAVARSDDRPVTFSVSMIAWLYRTGHTAKIGKATFIQSSSAPSAPTALTSSTLWVNGSFIIPNENLSNPSLHGMHIRDPIYHYPGDPPENGTGPHGGWIGSSHRYGAAELSDFDPSKDHFGDLKNVPIVYNTTTSPPQSEGNFQRNLTPAASQGITFEDDIQGEVIAIDDQADSPQPSLPLLYGAVSEIVAILLVPGDFDTRRLAELSPDWSDDAGGPLASFPLRTVEHQKVGRAQFALGSDPKNHRPRLTLNVSIYADLDLAEGRHTMKLKRSDGTLAPIRDKIGISVTPLSGGASFSEARLEADLTDLFVDAGSRTDFLVGASLVIDGTKNGEDDATPRIVGQVPPAR